MIAVERLEDQYLVAGIQQRHRRRMQSRGRAARHHHFGLGVVAQAVVAQLLVRDGRAQPRDAVEPRVDVVSGEDRRNAQQSPPAPGTGVSQTPWARLMPPMRSHSTLMARISDCMAPGASSLNASRDVVCR